MKKKGAHGIGKPFATIADMSAACDAAVVQQARRIRQTFCKTCAGMLTLAVDGKVVPSSDWHKHGMSVDIGCIC